MNIINRDLYIVPTSQQARDLKSLLIQNQKNAFVVVKSLEMVINEIFSKISTDQKLEKELAAALLYKLIKEYNIEHFSYLSNSSESLYYIYDFIVKCTGNNVPFSTLISGEKLDAITTLNQYYQNFKLKNRLCDHADLERYVATKVIDPNINFFNQYQQVYIVDQFKTGNICFLTSNDQKEILTQLKTKYPLYHPVNKNETKCAQKISVKQPLFNHIDEVKAALKIVRKLMLSGVSDQEILVVTTDIAEYAPLFRLFLKEYGLKGYDTQGIPLAAYKDKYFGVSDQVAQTYERTLQEFNALKKRSRDFAIPIDEESLWKTMLNTQFVPMKQIGIRLTESNQLIGTSKRYQHIIFIGTDIEHFPPKGRDNFLYTVAQSIQYLRTNNYYDSSKQQYRELEQLSDHLYILNAEYKDKKKLTPSILVPEKNQFDTLCDISDIQSDNDLPFTETIKTPDIALNNYLTSVTDTGFTEFDGLNIDHEQVDHLSPSQLNQFAACPLSYLYLNELQIKKPKKPNAGFEYLELGSLTHSMFERFSKEVKSGETPNYKLMQKVSQEVQDNVDFKKNILHELDIKELEKGLNNQEHNRHEERGPLARFVDYVIQEGAGFDFFKNSAFEIPIFLDQAFNPVETKEESFIRGVVDRIDHLSNEINILDYKSKKKISNPQECEKMKAITEFQLPLYTLYALQKEEPPAVTSSFITFNHQNTSKTSKKDINKIEFGCLSTNTAKIEKSQGVHFDQTYKKRLIEKVSQIKVDIENGDFYFDQKNEKRCSHCHMKHLCHHKLLTKTTSEQSI